MKEKAACNLIEKFEIDIRDLSYGWETICLKFDAVSKELELVKLGRQANQSELQKVLLSAVIRMRAHQALKVNQ